MVTWAQPGRSNSRAFASAAGIQCSLGLAVQGGRSHGWWSELNWGCSIGWLPMGGESHHCPLSQAFLPSCLYYQKCERILRVTPCFWWNSRVFELQVEEWLLEEGGAVAPFRCPFMFSPHFPWTQIPLPRQTKFRLFLVSSNKSGLLQHSPCSLSAACETPSQAVFSPCCPYNSARRF